MKTYNKSPKIFISLKLANLHKIHYKRKLKEVKIIKIIIKLIFLLKLYIYK